ncbi:MAG: hypothetical protein ACQUHE_00940 [Bacteroidia bacterium]
MDPFNIQIEDEQELLTLTILPENDYFKIVYFGGVIGAVRKLDSEWLLLTEEEIEVAGLPLYDYKKGLGMEAKLELDLPKINQITAQIENFIS